MDNCLKKGYELSFPGQLEKYTIIDIIGRGASTIAYLARTESGIECILKEYFPRNLSLERDSSGGLKCDIHDLERFEQGKQDFFDAGNRQREIRNIVQFRNETPPFLGIYKANNTQYSVIAVFTGKTFDKFKGELLHKKIKVCYAVAKLVSQYHKKEYLCLDIKPDNIFVLMDSSGEIVTEIIEYIDFDSVRKKCELTFGHSISFTKNWSAPEQMNPYGYSKICEATDIYTIGELVFWSVFGRHSQDDEHRDYSVYPFEEVTEPDSRKILSRNIVQNTLSDLFHSTLRPSPQNRFQTMDKLVQLLEKLTDELEKNEYIIESAIRPKEFFIGRNNELRQIDEALHKHDVVFVSGIAGIGKSELVKQYICAHKKEYDNILYWIYDGNIDNMVARESTVRISEMSRIAEESDSQYAKRILSRANELTFNSNNLIVIDNLDQPIGELAQEGTWEKIKALHGKILITTRVRENLYQSITIDTLSNADDLFRLFQRFCPFSDEELESVRDIINLVDCHTLLIELLAHLTEATHTSPSQTLKKLRNSGISGLPSESVQLLKDGKVLSSSVKTHLEKIFSMESMSDDYILVLAMLSFMPTDGVEISKFASFFSIENYDDINWLIKHGWISRICNHNNPSADIVTIHPVVASVVVEYVKTAKHLCDIFFVKNCDAIKTHNHEQISEIERIQFADSLVSATTKYSIKCRSAAIFIEQYIDQYSKYGNTELKLAQIDFAIRVLEESRNENKYSAVLEEAYHLKVNLLWAIQQYKSACEICKKHFKRAKKSKDIYFAAKWRLTLLGVYGSCFPKNYIPLKLLGYYWSGTWYTSIVLMERYRKKPYFLSSERLLKKLDYDYLSKLPKRMFYDLVLVYIKWAESWKDITLFYSNHSIFAFITLLFAEGLRVMLKREEQFSNNDNTLKISIIKAKKLFLFHQYQKAEELLLKLPDCESEQNISTSATYYIHQFLAQVTLRKEPRNYETAIAEFERCLEISEDLLLHNTYVERIELGYLYIICGQLSEAEVVNTDLLKKTQLLSPDIRKTYYADILRNIGCLYYIQGEYEIACDMLQKALREYDKAIAPDDLISFGKARTYKYLALCASNNTDAIDQMKKARNFYKSCVGCSHPETKECLAQLDELKSRQQ